MIAATRTLMLHLVAPNGVPDPQLLGDLLELWVMSVGWIAETAAARARADELAPLREVLGRLERGEGDLAVLDLDWLSALALLTDNRAIEGMAALFRTIILENRAMFSPLYASRWYDPSPHRKTLEALEQGDVRAAGDAAREYGRRTYRALGLAVPERGAKG